MKTKIAIFMMTLMTIPMVLADEIRSYHDPDTYTAYVEVIVDRNNNP